MFCGLVFCVLSLFVLVVVSDLFCGCCLGWWVAVVVICCIYCGFVCILHLFVGFGFVVFEVVAIGGFVFECVWVVVLVCYFVVFWFSCFELIWFSALACCDGVGCMWLWIDALGYGLVIGWFGLVGWIGCVVFGGLGYIVDVLCLVGCVGGWLYWFGFEFGVCSFGVYCLLLCITLCCWVFVWFV